MDGKYFNVGCFSENSSFVFFECCMMIISIDLYPFFPVSVTLVKFQIHSTCSGRKMYMKVGFCWQVLMQWSSNCIYICFLEIRHEAIREIIMLNVGVFQMLFVIVGDLWNYACLLGLGVVIISDEWVLSVQTLTGLSVSIYVYADSCAVLIWWCYSLVCFRYWSTQCVTTSSPGTGRSVTTMPFWWTSGSAFRKWSSPLLAGMHSWRAQLQICIRRMKN